MGVVVGKNKLDEPHFKVLKSGEYEIRHYKPCFVAEVPYAQDPDTARKAICRYIGVSGFPCNKQEERIVGPTTQIVAPPPSMTEDTVLQIILPAHYQEVAEIPKPDNPNITILAIPERVVAVRQFSGSNSPDRSHKKLLKLRDMLMRDGFLASTSAQEGQQEDVEHAVTWNVVEYNPEVTLPFLRRNEVWIELTVQGNAALQKLLQKGDQGEGKEQAGTGNV